MSPPECHGVPAEMYNNYQVFNTEFLKHSSTNPTMWIYVLIWLLHTDSSVSSTHRSIYRMLNEDKVFKVHIDFTEV